MSVKSDLLNLVETVAQRVQLPPVAQVFIPEPNPGPDRHTEFGMVILEDGAAGLYYAWLGAAQQGMGERYAAAEFEGRPALDLARYFAGEDEADCSLGLAAVNAITQCIYRRAGFSPAAATDSLGLANIGANDHIGMVGYFPSLVKRLESQGVRLTVIEKKPRFQRRRENLTVTLDPEALSACNKVIITATALLNNTIDEVLDYSAQAEQRVMIGPTAGFFPDPLFQRGIAALGGAAVRSATKARRRLCANQGLGDSAVRFLARAAQYPGLEQLLARCQGDAGR